MMVVSENSEHDTHLRIVAVAERLFAQIGFHKTTVADIARELHMSPANVYRFFSAKAEINEAVARRLFDEAETEVAAIASGRAKPSHKLRTAIATIEKQNAQRFLERPKLQELIETAFNERWSIVQGHSQTLNNLFGEIIAEGNRAGDFRVEDCELAAILVRSACLRFCHPRLMVECAQDPEPTLDQLVDFCLRALARPGG